jgi:RHS repeat-associated protein
VTRVWSPLYVDGLIGSDEHLGGENAFNEGERESTTLQSRSYVRADANWNVTSLVRASAAASPVWATVERYEYDPYGSVTYLSGSFGVLTASSYGQKYLHQGGRLDEVTGLYSFRFREYDPVQGRWKQADPAGYVDGGSLYLSRSGSPNRLDPTGLDDTLNGPIDGLSHYYEGGGFPANIGDHLIDVLRGNNSSYLEFISRILARGEEEANCNGGTSHFTDFITEVGTGPFSVAGDAAWWNSDGWLYQELNVLVGTINSIDADATFTYSAGPRFNVDGLCCCEITISYSIHMKLEDRYGWRGVHNLPIHYLVVHPVRIATSILSDPFGPYRPGNEFQMTGAWNENGSFTVWSCD